MADNTLESQTLPNSSLPFGNATKRYATLKEWTDAEKGTGYDLEGYIGKNGIPDQSKGQHLTDEFKLPNHITFSTQSKYSTPETPGGIWAVEKKGKTPEEDTWGYTPSDFVIKQQGVDKLSDYFKKSEPNSILHLPNKGGGF
jgi:hypothetical protein